MRASPAPRALCRRSPPCCRARRSAGRAPRSPRGCPGSARRPPKRCQDAAQKFTARPGPERRQRSRAPAAPTPPRAPPRQPPTAPPQASRAHPAGGGAVRAALPPCSQRPARGAPSSTLVAGGLWGPQAGAGSPRRDRKQSPRAYLGGSFDGRRGAPWPRGGGGASGWPGGCAARRLPTFPLPTLPGEPTGPAASASVRTRRAAFHRGRRRRRCGRGPGCGARRYPQAAPRLPAAVPRAAAAPRSRHRGEGPPGRPPEPGAGPPRGGLSLGPEPRSFHHGPMALETPGQECAPNPGGAPPPPRRHLSRSACPRLRVARSRRCRLGHSPRGFPWAFLVMLGEGTASVESGC